MKKGINKGISWAIFDSRRKNLVLIETTRSAVIDKYESNYSDSVFAKEKTKEMIKEGRLVKIEWKVLTKKNERISKTQKSKSNSLLKYFPPC